MTPSVLYKISTDEILKNNVPYPRAEVEPIVGLDSDLRWYIIDEQERPPFDPSAEKLIRTEELTNDPHPIYTDFLAYSITYEIQPLTNEELEAIAVSNSEAKAFQQQQQILNAQVQQTAQGLTDEQALELKDVYPFWSGDSEVYNLDFKVKFFDGEIKLYKVVQAHTSQPEWTPPTVPALFTKIAPPGVIPDWKQPTGGQDAYNIGDQVYHDNPNDGGNIWLYESKIDANTTEPGRDGTFDRWWEPIEPKP
jgi:hypothetical protein